MIKITCVIFLKKLLNFLVYIHDIHTKRLYAEDMLPSRQGGINLSGAVNQSICSTQLIFFLYLGVDAVLEQLRRKCGRCELTPTAVQQHVACRGPWRQQINDSEPRAQASPLTAHRGHTAIVHALMSFENICT
jgi:hypothetical protein